MNMLNMNHMSHMMYGGGAGNGGAVSMVVPVVNTNTNLLNNNNNNNANSKMKTSKGQSSSGGKEKANIELDTKIRIINDCKVFKQNKVAEMYNIHPTTVSKIVKESQAIIAQFNYEKLGILPPVDHSKSIFFMIKRLTLSKKT
jgi:hypothetical protein